MNRPFAVLWTILVGFTECNNSGKEDYGHTDTIKQTFNIADTTGQTATVVYGQSFNHTALSKSFNFQSTITRFHLKYGDSCIVTVTLENKITRRIDYSINLTTHFLLSDSSFIGNNVRSYITGKNKDAEVVDNDFGDVVVADFNFDMKEDFAVKREEGGNGGPLYNYYIQTANTSFKLNKFLSDTMIWFPTYFDKNNKTLATLVHASAVSVAETTYRLDTLTGKWTEMAKRFIGYKQKTHRTSTENDG